MMGIYQIVKLLSYKNSQSLATVVMWKRYGSRSGGALVLVTKNPNPYQDTITLTATVQLLSLPDCNSHDILSCAEQA